RHEHATILVRRETCGIGDRLHLLRRSRLEQIVHSYTQITAHLRQQTFAYLLAPILHLRSPPAETNFAMASFPCGRVKFEW
ncbi:MAG TPA: hypothetical protein VGD36_13560, partial [Xanthobacteraceae bacterium]